jgi:hypothetical protein
MTMQATIINGGIPNFSISFLKNWCLLMLMGLVHGCYHSNLVSICSINDKCSLHGGLKSLTIQTHFVLLVKLVTLRQLSNHFTNIFPTLQKKHLEMTKLGEIMETKGLKILNNVKTHIWIFMLKPIQMGVARISSIIVKDGTRQPYNPSCCLQLGAYG